MVASGLPGGRREPTAVPASRGMTTKALSPCSVRFAGDEADVEEKTMQVLYMEGENFVFMDNQSYDQLPFTPEQVGDAKKFLK